MYDATARFMAEKLKEYCEDKKHCCDNCVFGYHPTYIGPDGEHTAYYFDCRLSEDSPNEWNIPKEDRT